jgi:hypothetical protein
MVSCEGVCDVLRACRYSVQLTENISYKLYMSGTTFVSKRCGVAQAAANLLVHL